jgi:hypothetical protein
MVYESEKGKEGWELFFHRFGDSRSKSVAKSKKNCAQVGFGISEAEFLKLACGKDGASLIDLSTGKLERAVDNTSSADFALSAFSGNRFALGSLENSKAHVVKQLVNPLTYIEALGTCCDDPVNLIRVRVFDRHSGRLLTELHWKINKKESARDRYPTRDVALSPTGKYLSICRGVNIEVYEIPNAVSQ